MTRRNSRFLSSSAAAASVRTALREIDQITMNDTNVMKVRRCRGCFVVWRNYKQSLSHPQQKRKRKNTTATAAAASTTSTGMASGTSAGGVGVVRSFGGMGILVISDQRIMAYIGGTLLFHAPWSNATDMNPNIHIEYCKDTYEPLLCLSVVDTATFFTTATTITSSSSLDDPVRIAGRRRRRTDTTRVVVVAGGGADHNNSNNNIEFRFATPHASVLKRRIQYILHWYLDLECAPGTQRRYATEIFC